MRTSETQMWDEVLPGLWQGGTPDDEWIDIPAKLDGGVDRDSRPFDAVVTLFALAHPMGWGVAEMRFGFADSHPDESDMDSVLRAAQWARSRWRSGDRVLIRCQAGLNRSGLVTALVLMLDGWTATDAIVQIRATRSPRALCNADFVDWLQVLDVPVADDRAA